MNRMFTNLQNIVYQMIDFNLEKQKQFSKNLHSLYSEQFSRYYKTIEYNPGRQSGITTLIAKSVEQNDVVIVLTPALKKHMYNRISVFHLANIPVFAINSLPPSNGTDTKYNRIWVDCASNMPQGIISEIYEKFNGNQYIFLG